MINSLPIKLYYDTFDPKLGTGAVKNSLIVSYDVFKINELRNYKNKTNVKVVDESPFVMAGVYIFIKVATVPPSLLFFDPLKNELYGRSLKNTGNERNDFIFNEMVNYINNNYHLLSKEITLIEGVPSFIRPLD